MMRMSGDAGSSCRSKGRDDLSVSWEKASKPGISSPTQFKVYVFTIKEHLFSNLLANTESELLEGSRG